MKLPNAERAVIDEGKLAAYCLDPEHERGRHKAILFRAVMGLGPGDASVLASTIRERALHDEVDVAEAHDYGTLYVMHHPIEGSEPRRTLRHVWIVRHGEDVPRLVSSYLVRYR